MERPLQITYKGLETSEFLDALIRERAEKLERFHPNVIGCRVVVEVPHRSPESAKTPIGIAVEVEVAGSNMVVAKAGTERREAKNDHTQIVTRAFDMVQRQLEDSHTARRDQQCVAAHRRAVCAPDLHTVADRTRIRQLVVATDLPLLAGDVGEPHGDVVVVTTQQGAAADKQRHAAAE